MQRFILISFLLFTYSGFSQSFIDFYFKSKGIDGGILIYNEKKDSWIFNQEYDVKRNTPIGSLFHLPNALIGLDLGIVSNNPAKAKSWDGIKRYHFGEYKKNWSCFTNLDEALLFKNDWYFQDVSNLIGERNYDFFLKHLNTTNFKFDKKENYYWHFGGLFSTPEKQIDFLRKLKKQEFFFKKENQQYVYDRMLLIDNNTYSIHGYETYNVYKGDRIDWWIGVLETKDNTYYFSTRIFESVEKKLTKEFFNKKIEITIEVFKILGYI